MIGVSEYRIRKKLRMLLTNALQDETEREKLQELEVIERQLGEGGIGKRKQEELRRQLKQ